MQGKACGILRGARNRVAELGVIQLSFVACRSQSNTEKLPHMPTAQTLSPIGILGGTFDPIHLAHLRLAEEALDQLALAAVRWIPAGQPVHRHGAHAAQASPQQRLAMLRLALGEHPQYVIDSSEIERAEASYTVPTLERLRAPPLSSDAACMPASVGMHERPLVLLLGSDAFMRLHTWHRWADLFSLAHIAIAHRPGCLLDPSQLHPALRQAYAARYSADVGCLKQSAAGRIVSFALTPLAISATQIRQLIACGKSPRYLVADAVLDYLHSTRLYAPVRA